MVANCGHLHVYLTNRSSLLMGASLAFDYRKLTAQFIELKRVTSLDTCVYAG